MIAYPEGLSIPTGDGYGFEHVSSMTSTKLVTGRVMQRRAFSSTPTTLEVTWLLDSAETQLFEGWYEYVLVSGSLPFECPLKTPLGLGLYQANFADIYKGPVLAGLDCWKITAPLRLFKRPLIDKEWVTDTPDYILDSDIFDRAMNQEWPK